jgi:hypothetical protein
MVASTALGDSYFLFSRFVNDARIICSLRKSGTRRASLDTEIRLFGVCILRDDEKFLRDVSRLLERSRSMESGRPDSLHSRMGVDNFFFRIFGSAFL